MFAPSCRRARREHHVDEFEIAKMPAGRCAAGHIPRRHGDVVTRKATSRLWHTHEVHERGYAMRSAQREGLGHRWARGSSTSGQQTSISVCRSQRRGGQRSGLSAAHYAMHAVTCTGHWRQLHRPDHHDTRTTGSWHRLGPKCGVMRSSERHFSG